ncbi:MAG: stalk domain-containing protein [Filifactoraceae bacterium]
MKMEIRKFMATMIAGAITMTPVLSMAETMVKEEVKIQFSNGKGVKEKRFIESEGMVESITEASNGLEVLVRAKESSFRLNVPKGLLVINQEQGRLGSIEDITKGSKISFYTTPLTPIGLSEPAFLTPEFLVTNTDKNSHRIDTFDKEYLNTSKDLKLNMDENTPIITQNGTKIKLYPEDIIDKDVLVVYSIVTASIPAQTNPNLVILLNKGDIKPVEETKPMVEIPTYKNQYGINMMGFGAMAKQEGYTVTWDEKNHIAMAKKDDKEVKVYLKRKAISLNDKELKIAYPIETKDGRIFLPEDAYINVFPKTNNN